MSGLMQRRRPRSERLYTRGELDDLDRLATMLDTQWRIPGTGIRFGIDAVVGLLPGIGDLAVGSVAAYIVYRAWALGVPKRTLVRMAANVGIDTLVGSVPVLGSVFDVFYKASARNMGLLRRHLERNLNPSEAAPGPHA